MTGYFGGGSEVVDEMQERNAPPEPSLCTKFGAKWQSTKTYLFYFYPNGLGIPDKKYFFYANGYYPKLYGVPQ